MINSASQVFFLGAEKQLPLLPQMQDVGGISKRGIDIVGDHYDSEAGRLIDVGDLSVQTSGRDRVKT